MPDFAAPASGGCLAFDFGETRIGAAQGDCRIRIAHPIATITGNSNDEKFARIAALIQEWQPENLIVGLPVHIDGSEHALTRLARKFGHRLNGRFRLPVYWVDERLSSVYAEELLRENGVRGRKQKPVLDQVAAQAILQSFFDSGAVDFFDRQADADGSDKGFIMKTSLALIFCALSLSLSAGTATAKTRHAKASPKARHAAQASGNALPLKANGCAHFTAGKGSYRFSVPDEGKALHSSASGVLTAPDGETLYMARGIDTDSGAAFHFADLPEAGSYAVRFDRGGKVSVCIE